MLNCHEINWQEWKTDALQGFCGSQMLQFQTRFPSSLSPQFSASRTSAAEPSCRARRSTSSTSCHCPSPSSLTSSPSPWPTAWTPSWCTDARTRWSTRPAAPKATAWSGPSPSVHRRARRRTAPATTVRSPNFCHVLAGVRRWTCRRR